MKNCKNCKWYSIGVPDNLRKKWNYCNTGIYATGICNLKFPKGYICVNPPHPAFESGYCFQFENKIFDNQLTLNLD